MGRPQVAKLPEPPRGELRQEAPLVRNGLVKDHVERREAIGCNQQKLILVGECQSAPAAYQSPYIWVTGPTPNQNGQLAAMPSLHLAPWPTLARSSSALRSYAARAARPRPARTWRAARRQASTISCWARRACS